jgi:hypothetical protein
VRDRRSQTGGYGFRLREFGRMVSLNSDMKASLTRFALFSVMFSLAASGCLAQSSGSSQPENLHGLKVKELHPVPTPTPFPLDVASGAPGSRVQSLEFLAPDAMSAADRELAASAQTEITRRAGLQGFQLGTSERRSEAPRGASGGVWGYEQAVCPVFPDHLVLEYSRRNGAGDVTLFSAVIPRGEGHVRVIPVRRRSYSLFTPASSNALTLNDFNHMVLEEPSGLSPDWLTLGLCYAALAGGHVRAELVADGPADETYPLLRPAQLIVSRKGGAEVDFADATAPKSASLDWTLTFAQNGRLLKVSRKPSHELVEKPTKESTIDLGSNASKPAN